MGPWIGWTSKKLQKGWASVPNFTACQLLWGPMSPGDVPLLISSIWQNHNDWEYEKGNRAYLPDRPYSLEDFDTLAEALGRTRASKAKRKRLNEPPTVFLKDGPVHPSKYSHILSFYTEHLHPAAFANALRAGFYIFGTEYLEDTGRTSEAGLLALELGGRARQPKPEEADPGGRWLLQVAQLHLGSKARRHAADYQMNRSSFSEVWPILVAVHGLDWCGFARVRAAYEQYAGADPANLLCWALRSKDGQLVSVEAGYVVGRIYVCLSHATPRASQHARAGHLRLECVLLLLAGAGVQLFDAGTTAQYYAAFGFKKTTRREFLLEWHKHREGGLAGALPDLLSNLAALYPPAALLPPRPTQKPFVRVQFSGPAPSLAELQRVFPEFSGIRIISPSEAIAGVASLERVEELIKIPSKAVGDCLVTFALPPQNKRQSRKNRQVL